MKKLVLTALCVSSVLALPGCWGSKEEKPAQPTAAQEAPAVPTEEQKPATPSEEPKPAAPEEQKAEVAPVASQEEIPAK